MWWMEAGRWIWNTVYILCIIHVHDVDGSGTQSIYYVLYMFMHDVVTFHIECFSSRIPFLFQYRSINVCIMTCISGTSRGSTEVQEEKTGLIRYLLEYLWTSNE